MAGHILLPCFWLPICDIPFLLLWLLFLHGLSSFRDLVLISLGLKSHRAYPSCDLTLETCKMLPLGEVVKCTRNLLALSLGVCLLVHCQLVCVSTWQMRHRRDCCAPLETICALKFLSYLQEVQNCRRRSWLADTP